MRSATQGTSETMAHAYVVILAGGSGTRLWPTSRDKTPKQFLKLGGTRTLMQQAADRILPLIPWDHMIVVTNAQYLDEVRKELPEIPAQNIIAEPAKRDTALAMAVGSLVAQHLDPEAVVINLASDHVLQDEEEYRRVIQTALEVAAQKTHLLTVGITPTGPNVNFGYIKVDGELTQHNGYSVKAVNSFKEKPDEATARQFLAEGNYYWNANMYTWHVDTIAAAFERYMPDAMPGLNRIREAIGTADFESVLAEVYEAASKISIDVAISEKANNLVLLPGDFGWDDVGLWSTVFELGKKDEHGSVIVQQGENSAPVVALNAERNLIATSKRLIALAGVSDLVVIDSQDVLLIVPRDKAADVKKVVESLSTEELKQYL